MCSPMSEEKVKMIDDGQLFMQQFKIQGHWAGGVTPAHQIIVRAPSLDVLTSYHKLKYELDHDYQVPFICPIHDIQMVESSARVDRIAELHQTLRASIAATLAKTSDVCNNLPNDYVDKIQFPDMGLPSRVYIVVVLDESDETCETHHVVRAETKEQATSLIKSVLKWKQTIRDTRSIDTMSFTSIDKRDLDKLRVEILRRQCSRAESDVHNIQRDIDNLDKQMEALVQKRKELHQTLAIAQTTLADARSAYQNVQTQNNPDK